MVQELWIEPSCGTAEAQYAEIEAETFTSDDWETPEPVARLMHAVLEREMASPGFTDAVIEIGAGNGAIAKHAHPTRWQYIAIEQKAHRVRRGQQVAPHATWVEGDYLKADHDTVGAVIANLPFSVAMPLVAHAAERLWSEGCMVLLLPTEFFQSKARGAHLNRLGLHIAAEVRLRGRVGFIKCGEEQRKRQCYDSIFVLRFTPGSTAIVDPYDAAELAAFVGGGA